jgi:small subunit ribosomal protein S17
MTNQTEQLKCNDRCCPVHGNISLRGRSFYGTVIKKFPKRIIIEFERTIYVKKYERYSKRKTRIHARLSDCMWNNINIGDYIEVKETRPISKIINFVVVGKVSKETLDTKK